MSFWYGDRSTEKPTSVATGQAPLEEIMSAARDQQRYVDNSDSSYRALYRAYDDRIKAIKDRTGETRENPLLLASRNAMNEWPDQAGGALPEQGSAGAGPQMPAQMQEFNDWLAQMAERHPDALDAIRPDVPLERDAEALARHTDGRLAKAMASRDGGGKWAAVLAGGLYGSLYDPLQVTTLFLGGGAGAGRTAVTRIAKTALQETVINGLSEAVLQPQVQSWRKQAGLPNGLQEAMTNVGFAAVAGGVIGGGLAGAGEAASRLMRGPTREAAARELAKSPTVRPDVAAALNGDGPSAVEALRPIRSAMPAEVRGALDHADLVAHGTSVRPLSASDTLHDLNIDRATRASLRNQPFIVEPDPDQVARIIERLAPAPAEVDVNSEQSLQQFLMAAGGVKDFKGELDALGLSKASERFVGKLVRKDGMPLDEARRAAAEAGFFRDRFGTVDEAMEKSTVNDLLDALDTTASPTASRRGDADRAYMESLVADVAARAGPAVDDDLIVRAIELSNAENIDPADALDRVLIENDAATLELDDASATAAAARFTDPDTLTGGLADPAQFADDALFTPADLDGLPDDYDIPFFDDGRTLTPVELMAELEHHENLYQLVKACRI